MRIGHKIGVGYLAISLSLGAFGYVAAGRSETALRLSIVASEQALATSILSRIEDNVASELAALEAYSRTGRLRDAVEASNRSFDAMADPRAYIDEADREWIGVPTEATTPHMRRLLASSLSEELRERIGLLSATRGHNVLPELFVTNKYGATVALNQKTTDYRQDDERWWQQAMVHDRYVEEIEYDPSAGVYALSIAVAIKDAQGRAIGVMKGVFDVSELVQLVHHMKVRAPLDDRDAPVVKLISASGKLIYSTAPHTVLEDVPDVFAAAAGASVIVVDPERGPLLCVRSAMASGEDATALGWVLVSERSAERAFAPMRRLRRQMLLAAAVLAAISILLGWHLARGISVSLKALGDSAELIASGDLAHCADIRTGDEIEQLAGEFNRMASRLAESYASIEQKVIDRTRELREEMTQREQAEQQTQRHAERLQSLNADLARSNSDLEEFTHSVSHDLREPLRKVRTFGQFLAEDCGEELSPEGREHLRIIQDAVERMRDLIEHLLRLARVGTQGRDFAPADARAVIDRVLTDMSERIRETDAAFDIGADMPLVMGDEIQLGQLFQNLIGNALKFQPPGRAPRIEIRSAAEGDRVAFSVRDNGIGIEAQNLEKVFGVFVRLHGQDEYEGSGVGLSLCQKIVQRHGGTIRVESEPGVGTTFHFTLNAAPRSAGPDAKRPPTDDGNVGERPTATGG